MLENRMLMPYGSLPTAYGRLSLGLVSLLSPLVQKQCMLRDPVNRLQENVIGS